MDLFRLTSPAFGLDISGRGGLFVSGRWHLQGYEVLYTSPSIALAALELLVQPRVGKTLPALVLQTLSLPTDFDFEAVAIDTLPHTWQRSDPYDPYTQNRGVAFLTQGLAPALRVPSAVIPQEHNYILSLQRAKVAGLSLVSCQPFEWDQRIWKASDR